MHYAVFDLFGGTTQLFEDEQEALEAADRLLDHYQSAAYDSYWQDPPYAPEILVMRVTHRAVQVIGRHSRDEDDCVSCASYQIEAVAACFSTQSQHDPL